MRHADKTSKHRVNCCPYVHLAYTSRARTHTNHPSDAHEPAHVHDLRDGDEQQERRAALDAVYLTGAGSEDVVSSEIGRVLNGAVVGVVSSLDSEFEGSDSTGPFRYTQGASLPDPASSTCLGLALVRAVSPAVWSDSEDLRLHVLTPVPPRTLQDGRVFVKGELELPVWGMLDFRAGDTGGVAGVERGKVPFLRWGRGEGVGAEVRRVRRNLMRRGQI
ncbi:hypothetical protein EWM64_g6729 [Hericium alpestre]|uniref:Uncharacterized protein n=1 Tax=Hericium alpestre TaxID=135208 RepID=A0A4Y9ZTX7_9AGAM|nr:hypothetical protein EWM64_g6729 [Hericium alpestre]